MEACERIKQSFIYKEDLKFLVKYECFNYGEGEGGNKKHILMPLNSLDVPFGVCDVFCISFSLCGGSL